MFVQKNNLSISYITAKMCATTDNNRIQSFRFSIYFIPLHSAFLSIIIIIIYSSILLHDFITRQLTTRRALDIQFKIRH